MTQGRQPEKKTLPPGKRTGTWRARGGRKQDRPKGGPPAPKKRPPTPLLVAWVVAVIFLASLIYFAAESRRLPELTADLPTPKTAENSQAPTAPSGAKVDPASQKREEVRDLASVVEQSEEKTERSSLGSDNSAQSPLPQASPPLAYTAKVRPAPRTGGAPSPDISPRQARVSIVIDDFGTDVGDRQTIRLASFPCYLVCFASPGAQPRDRRTGPSRKAGK